MKNLYFFLMAVLFTWTSTAQTPLLYDPVPNQTVGHLSVTRVLALANNPRTQTLHCKVFVNDPRQLVYATSHTFASASETSSVVMFPLPVPNGLIASQQYLLELTAEGAGRELLGQQYFTFFTTYEPTPPVLVGSMPRYLCRHRYDRVVAGTTSITVNANHPQAHTLKLKVLDDQGKLVSGGLWPQFGERELEKILSPAEAMQNQTFLTDIFLASPATDTVHTRTLVLTTENAQGQVIAVRTIPTSDMIRLPENHISAGFVNPVNGATQVPVRPTIQMRTALDILGAEAGCQQVLTYQRYELDRYPADWTGNDYQSITTQAPSWQPTNSLQPNTTYQVRVSYSLTHTPSLGGFITSTFTTVVVQVPPTLISPVVSPNWYTCGGRYDRVATISGVVVNPGHPSVRKLKLKVLDANGKLISGGPYPQYDTRELELTVTASQAMNNHTLYPNLFFDFSTGGYSTQANCSLILTSEDSLGRVVGVATYAIPHLIRLPQNRMLTPPVCVYPTTGTVGVATRPRIQMAAIPDSVYEDVPCRLRTLFGQYELDKYPADWTGTDYQQVSGFSLPDNWQPAGELQPNTTYQVRVLYIQNPAFQGPTYVTTTFTTGAAVAGRLGSKTIELPSVVSPVPFSETMRVHIQPAFKQTLVRLTTLEGKLLYSRIAKGGDELQLDTRRLPAGVYVVSLTDGAGKTEHLRVVKQ